MPAPTCTDGPSRPSAMPLASETEHRPNFPSTVRKLMYPSRRNSAALVCGMPLPRAFGKYRASRKPVPSAPGDRNDQTPPGRAVRRIQPRAEIFRQQDERDHHQADRRPR